MLSRTLPPKSTFKIMSISLTTIAVIMGAVAAAAHPSEAVSLITDPVPHLKFLMSGVFPWAGVLYTGLLSTDLALLIEVCNARQLLVYLAHAMQETQCLKGRAAHQTQHNIF